MGRIMEAKGGVARASAGPWKFVREVRSELKKVVWPTYKQTASYTGFVVVFTLIVVAVIALLDALFNFGLHLYLR